MNTLDKGRASYFNEFEDDRMSNLDMLDTFGGIVLNKIIDVIADEKVLSDFFPVICLSLVSKFTGFVYRVWYRNGTNSGHLFLIFLMSIFQT